VVGFVGGTGLLEMTAVEHPLTGPADEPEEPSPVVAPRLSRHTFTLSDGRRIGLSVSGRGVPLVVVHGYTAEGFLYAQTLHRLVSKGFKVVAIDMAGHGASEHLAWGLGRLGDYSDIMSQSMAELGIRKAVIAGHSMGGRVAAGLGAMRPDQVVALLLIDAIVGDEWDQMVLAMRFAPPLLAGMGAALLFDGLTTLPVFKDPKQAAKLWRLLMPTYAGNVTRPWRLFGPGMSILRSRGSRAILDELASQEVPTFVISGDRDPVVPICTARSAADRANGQLVTVRGAGHSWMLTDPETLPAIVSQLLEDRLGLAIRRAITAAGAESVDELESIFYERDAPILGLSPVPSEVPMEGPVEDAGPAPAPGQVRHRAPRYRWRID
jgi:pimeloyl-ACP methyl ester carboxylesterase